MINELFSLPFHDFLHSLGDYRSLDGTSSSSRAFRLLYLRGLLPLLTISKAIFMKAYLLDVCVNSVLHLDASTFNTLSVL